MDSVITDHCSRYSIILSLSLRNGELLLSRQYFLIASYIFLLCRKIFCITNGDYKGFCVIHRRFVTHDRKRRNNDNSLIITRFPENRKGQPCDCPFNFRERKTKLEPFFLFRHVSICSGEFPVFRSLLCCG